MPRFLQSIFRLSFYSIIRLSVYLTIPFGCLNATAGPSDPPIPVIERPVHLSDHKEYERPYMPVYRTTHDGRLGVNFKDGVQLYLFNPEKFGTNFHDSPNGQAILSSPTPYFFSKNNIHNSDFPVQNHVTLCEPTDSQGDFQSPRACGSDDCYDVVFMTTAWTDATQKTRQFWGTKATVRVENPKTPSAQIKDVTFEEPQAGTGRFTFNNIFEPMFTKDGNLMFGRIEDSRITWHNRATNVTTTGRYDIVYLPAPQDHTRSCDINQWDEVKPIGHAPYDPEINQTYGFAAQPFRDAMGNVIPDGTDLSGTYPWMDSEGDNIGFSTLGTDMIGDFPISCVDKRGCDDNNLHPSTPPFMGKTIVGLWTQGKMVLMDNLTNNIDYSKPQMEDNGHRNIDMYQAGSRADGSGTGLVRVGNGRDNVNTRNGLPDRSPVNTTFLESTENKFQFWQNLRPTTPRDVVWHMSGGSVSDEFAFDDYLYPNTFISSSMVQAVSNTGNRITQYNGLDGNAAYVQNGAGTPDKWNTPSYGRVLRARIERVAMGGIHGKGIWLSGNNARLAYTIDAQPRDIRQSDWHTSIFVDPRFSDDNTARPLITFPDRSELQLVGKSQVAYWQRGAGVVRTIDLPHNLPEHGWAHIGVQMSQQNRTATLYVNGYEADVFTHTSAFFELSPGTLFVGDNPNRNVPGVRGWIDDFKIIAHQSNKEEWCNHANGTLMGFNQTSGKWFDWANAYPVRVHTALSSMLQANNETNYSKYACYHDYTRDFGAHVGNIPANHYSVRESIHFPEGPLIHDQPRPDSSQNAFCLSCHVPGAKKGLGLHALVLDPSLTAAEDKRRQPSQPYPKVHGNIPANWLGAGVPQADMVAPFGGLNIDELLLTHNPPVQTAPAWPETNKNPIRKGQSLVHKLSGMELKTNDTRVNLEYAPTEFELFDWLSLDAGNGYVYLQNPSMHLRLKRTGDNRLEMSTVTNSGGNAQWRFEPAEGDWFYIVNRTSGLKLSGSANPNNPPTLAPATRSDASVMWQKMDYMKQREIEAASTCTGIDVPSASVSVVDTSAGNNGRIRLRYSDDSLFGGNRGAIQFSIDGGQTFPRSVNDTTNVTAFANLAPGTYNVWTRWGDTNCARALRTVTLN